MALFESRERKLAGCFSKLSYCNPFLPERIEAERYALGEKFVPQDRVWHARAGRFTESPNIPALRKGSVELAETVRSRLATGRKGNESEIALYEDLLLFALYHEFEDRILDTIIAQLEGRQKNRAIPYYAEFADRVTHFTRFPGLSFLDRESTPHLFAMFFHLRRAFYQIFVNLIGSSMAMARLRSQIWQSIFTHDMKRYRRILFDKMGDITTLITGPSGTGKELVARAIGQSRYIPFDPDKAVFAEDFSASFFALNLSALSGALIESELFGHRKGAFTGAGEDHVGWFEVCGRRGSVFLDEIGELDPAIQVKLLRVLQTRCFQRLGDTQNRQFQGKVIAATNRDISAEIDGGRFREDFYYRLCSDLIETPSLADQVRDDPEEIESLVRFVAHRQLGTAALDGGDGEVTNAADDLAGEVIGYLDEHLGRDYSWPGNFRELEQCVRNVMLRGEYRPRQAGPKGLRAQLASDFLAADGSADDMLQRYCTLAYQRIQSYEGTARALKLDRRTVKAKLDEALLDQLQSES